MSSEFDPDEPPPPVPNLKASVTDPFGYRGTLATSGVDRDIEAGMGTNTDHAADRISSGIGTDSSIKIQRTFDATSWALTRAASDDIMYRPQQHRWKQRQNSIGGTTPSSMIRIASQRVAAALPLQAARQRPNARRTSFFPGAHRELRRVSRRQRCWRWRRKGAAHMHPQLESGRALAHSHLQRSMARG